MIRDKAWFEMQDLIKKEYEKSVWIPLLSSQKLSEQGRIGYEGYEEEFFGSVAVMFPEIKKKEALECNWSDISLGHDNRPYAGEKEYVEAGEFRHYANGVQGKYLVLRQYFDYSDEHPEWHLSEDLVLALNLYRKDDDWLLLKENYLDVAHLRRDIDGRPICIEIRAEHLKDYLAARGAGILLSRFHSRRIIISDTQSIGWAEEYRQELKGDYYRWEGRSYAIHEGNCSPYGSQIAVFHVGRADVDYGEDVPTYGFPSDDKVKGEKKIVNLKGKKLFFVSGELWKTEWITPALNSPRVRGDKIESTIPFIVDSEGKSMCAGDLENSGRYLWFKPTIVNAILAYPKSILKWYTEDTGSLGLMGRAVHFGMNSNGLINIYAKDIALLPEGDKRIWVAHNISPEGGVSKELLQSQMEAEPADTKAPEDLLVYAVKALDEVAAKIWHEKLFLPHDKEEAIRNKIHRFQAVDVDGLLVLAKELTRFLIERLNYKLLKSLTPELESDAGSIKRLESLLYKHDLKGRELVAPLVGIYDLRKADAHLPSENFKDALKLIEIDNTENHVMMGKQIIYKVAERIHIIASLLLKKSRGRENDA